MILEIFLGILLILATPIVFQDELIEDFPVEEDILRHGSYNPDSMDSLIKFLEISNINERTYDIKNYNCVNFSNDLIKEAQSFGFNATRTLLIIPDTDNHMIVSVKIIDSVIFIEPQTDEILRFNQIQERFSASDVIIHGLIGKSIIIDLNGYIPENLEFGQLKLGE